MDVEAPRSLVSPTTHRTPSEWREGIDLARSLVTAHHPVCDRFRSDVFLVRGVPLCRGCLLTWPLFFVSLAATATILDAMPGLWAALAAIGLLLGVPQGTTYLKRWSGPVRAIAKLAGGIGLGLLVAALLLSPLPLWLRVATLSGLVFAFLALQAIRMKQILGVCHACPWHRDWTRCPGMQGARRPNPL